MTKFKAPVSSGLLFNGRVAMSAPDQIRQSSGVLSTEVPERVAGLFSGAHTSPLSRPLSRSTPWHARERTLSITVRLAEVRSQLRLYTEP